MYERVTYLFKCDIRHRCIDHYVHRLVFETCVASRSKIKVPWIFAGRVPMEIHYDVINGNISALLALCAGNSLAIGEFPSQRPLTRSFDVYFDLRLNKRLSKLWWGWWFEAPSCQLWRPCNEQEINRMISNFECKRYDKQYTIMHHRQYIWFLWLSHTSQTWWHHDVDLNYFVLKNAAQSVWRNIIGFAVIGIWRS